MNTLKKAWYTVLSGGGGYQLTAPTEAELLAYIMENFPPDFFLDPEQGIVDSSGNGVTVTQNGAPTLNANGGLNNRGYIALDGVDDAIVVNRVDIGTHAFVFRHNNTSQMLLNVPTSNTGSGDTPKFFKQGFQRNSGGYYVHLPDSGGTKRGIRTNIDYSASWRSFLCSGEGYSYNNGQSVFVSKNTAIADTVVTKMFYGCWGRGDGANLALFTAYDIGLSMIWSTELTADQLYIVHAYLEKRFNSYGNITYQYKPASLEIEASNPVFSGNSFSESTQDQAYSGTILPEGSAIFKGLTKDFYGFSSVDPDLLSWTDQDVVLAAGTTGQFDVNGLNICCVVKDGSTYYMMYSGRNASSEYQIGLATSSNALTGYTKSGSNPVLTLSAVNTALTKSYTTLYVNGLYKIGSTWYMWVAGIGGGANDIILFTGSELTAMGSPVIKMNIFDSPINTGSTPGTDDTGWPSVAGYIALTGFIKQGNKYIAQLTVSKSSSDILTGQRGEIIFSAIAEDDNFNFKCIGSGLLIDTGGLVKWNTTQVYLGNLIVDQDGEFLTPTVNPSGKWTVYFAGLGTTADAINTHGMTGLAYAPNKRIVENLL